jgi:hypothetical protein
MDTDNKTKGRNAENAKKGKVKISAALCGLCALRFAPIRVYLCASVVKSFK